MDKRKKFKSTDDVQKLTIAAYNMGPTALRRLLREHKTTSYDKISKYLPKETRNLVDFAVNNKPSEGGVEGYEPLIQAAFKLSNEGQIDMSNLNLDLLQPHIYKESYIPKTREKYNPKAESHVGAKGLGQFTPVTLKEFERLGWLKKGEDPYDINKSSELILRYQDHIAKSILKEASNFKTGGYILPKATNGYNNWGGPGAFLTNSILNNPQLFQNAAQFGFLREQPPAIMSQDRMGTDYNQTGLNLPLNNQPVEPLQKLAKLNLNITSQNTAEPEVPELSEGVDEEAATTGSGGLSIGEIAEKAKSVIGDVGQTIGQVLPLLGGVGMAGAQMFMQNMSQRDLANRQQMARMNNYLQGAKRGINKGMNSSMIPQFKEGGVAEDPPYDAAQDIKLFQKWINKNYGKKLKVSGEWDEDSIAAFKEFQESNSEGKMIPFVPSALKSMSKAVPLSAFSVLMSGNIGDTNVDKDFLRKIIYDNELGQLRQSGINYTNTRAAAGINPNTQVHELPKEVLKGNVSLGGDQGSAINTLYTLGRADKVVGPDGNVYVYDIYNMNDAQNEKNPIKAFSNRLSYAKNAGKMDDFPSAAYSTARALGSASEAFENLLGVPKSTALINLGRVEDFRKSNTQKAGERITRVANSVPGGVFKPSAKMQGGGPVDPSMAAMSKVITMRNLNTPWVSRGYYDNGPKMAMSDGSEASHLMGYSGPDEYGRGRVFPTIDMTDHPTGPNFLRPTNKAPIITLPSMKLADYYSKNGLIKH